MTNRSTKTKVKKSRSCIRTLCVLDSLLSLLVFSPITVGYWRGCWQLMDIYLFPENEKKSILASLALGLIPAILFILLQDCLTNTVGKRMNQACFIIISRLYTIISCFGCVNYWRGVWMAWDHYSGTSWESGVTSASIGLLFLCLTRGVNNIISPPFIAGPDLKKDYFRIPTLFSAKRNNCSFFLLDILFTVAVTGSLIVFVWRGSWVFLDARLFPDTPTHSAWGSMAIGVTVSVLAFFSQIVMFYGLRNLKKSFWKTVIEDLYSIFCFIGCVNTWRGVWNLLNIYLYPNNYALSNMVTTVGGISIMILFFCANCTIPLKGARMDGSQEGAKGVIFNTSYLRAFYKYNRKKRAAVHHGQQNKELHLSLDPCGYIDGYVDGYIDISKNNGLMDSRGRGDGNSYSDDYSIESENDESNL